MDLNGFTCIWVVDFMDTRELAGKLGLAWSDWWMGGSGGIGVVGGKPVFSHARRSERSADILKVSSG